MPSVIDSQGQDDVFGNFGRNGIFEEHGETVVSGPWVAENVYICVRCVFDISEVRVSKDQDLFFGNWVLPRDRGDVSGIYHLWGNFESNWGLRGEDRVS